MWLAAQIILLRRHLQQVSYRKLKARFAGSKQQHHHHQLSDLFISLHQLTRHPSAQHLNPSASWFLLLKLQT
eukprot:12915204-Prorocentrum_lima.AAC.1